MDTSKLEKGQVFKNYRELCRFLKEPITTGGGKINQIKRWERLFCYKRSGNKYIITLVKRKSKDNDIIDANPKAIKSITENDFVNEYGTTNQINKYKSNKSKLAAYIRKTILRYANHFCDIQYNKKTKNYDIYQYYDEPISFKDNYDGRFNVNYLDENKTGVYKIEDSNKNIYIGSTTVGFRKRFKQHYFPYDDAMYHTKELLDNGGIFSTVWVSNDNETEQEIRNMEEKYILEYEKNEDYNLINKKVPNYSKKSKFKYICIAKDDYEQSVDILSLNNIKIYTKEEVRALKNEYK